MSYEDPRVRPAIESMTKRLIASGMDPKQAHAQSKQSVLRVAERERRQLMALGKR